MLYCSLKKAFDKFNDSYSLDRIWCIFFLWVESDPQSDAQTLRNEKSFSIYPVTNRVLSCRQHGIARGNTTWFSAEPAH